MRKCILLLLNIGIVFYVNTVSPENLTTNSGENSYSRIKILNVNIEQIYKETKNVELPYFESTKKILQGAGFKIAEANKKANQATLEIKTTGTPLKSEYSTKEGNLILYTGAEIKGSLLLIAERKTILSRSFFWVINPPEFIMHRDSYKYKDSYNAPFGQLFEAEYPLLLGEIIYKVWGIDPLILLLEANKDSKNWVFQKKIVQIIGETRDKKAIYAITEFLKYENLNNVLSDDISKALSEFGEEGCDPLIRTIEKCQQYVEEQHECSPKSINRFVRVIGNIKCCQAAPHLINTLQWYAQRNTEIPKQIFWALQQLVEKEAISPLIALVDTPNDANRKQVIKMIEKISGMSFGEDKKAWLNWWSKNGDEFISYGRCDKTKN